MEFMKNFFDAQDQVWSQDTPLEEKSIKKGKVSRTKKLPAWILNQVFTSFRLLQQIGKPSKPLSQKRNKKKEATHHLDNFLFSKDKDPLAQL